METFDIRFEPLKLIEFDDLTSKASDLLAVWMKNGQIKRGSWPAATCNEQARAVQLRDIERHRPAQTDFQRGDPGRDHVLLPLALMDS